MGQAFSAMLSRFNTQPPEGGWYAALKNWGLSACFNTQPPEGGWKDFKMRINEHTKFQHTAARRRLADWEC